MVENDPLPFATDNLECGFERVRVIARHLRVAHASLLSIFFDTKAHQCAYLSCVSVTQTLSSSETRSDLAYDFCCFVPRVTAAESGAGTAPGRPSPAARAPRECGG